MAIACSYCSGEHENSAEVRQCWQDHNSADQGQGEPSSQIGQSSQLSDAAGASDDWFDSLPADMPTEPYDEMLSGQAASDDGPAPSPSRPSFTPARTSRRVAKAKIKRGAAPATAGPSALGRHCVIDEASVIDGPWVDAERLTISAALLDDPTPALATLRAAHHQRQRLVIVLASDVGDALDAEPAESTRREPFRLGTRFAFDRDELFHLLWCNSVDLRDPDNPRWVGLDTAIAAGASPSETGDVVLANGITAYLDGGPIRFTEPIATDAGPAIPVLHTSAIEHGSQLPPESNVSAADLAPDQLAAVTHPGGAARIIAPAGSGKTRVLTERARHLLSNWQLPSTAVSLVAFNKRAQEEITERTADLPTLQVRTLNAIALAIVNGTAPFEPQKKRWRTINEIEVRRIIGDLVTFPRRRNSDPVAPWIEALSLIRLGLVEPSEAEASFDGDVDGLAAMWPKFRDTLDRAGAVDFDDQIYRALLVLLTQPEARATAQRASRMMLVDEFQDLTPAHILLIRLLSSPGGAVFGVGDDDQTIYGYNGADPAWLIDFAGLFPGSQSHPLEVNYRCPAGIVDAADRLLRRNSRRVDKTIRAHSPAQPGWSHSSTPDPVAAATDAVSAAIDAGADPSDIAILTRVNALLAPIQVSLTGRGIPVSGGVGTEFTKRTAVTSILAWLRLATSGAGGPTRFHTDDLREALRRPSRSFHPRINDWVTEQSSIDDLQRLAGRLNNEKDATKVRDFVIDIQTMQQLVAKGATTAQLLDVLINQIGLAGAIGGLDTHRRGMNRAAQGDDLTAIGQLASLHEDPFTFGRWLNEQLETRRGSGGVMLSTVHRVKGQEWAHVVVHLADKEQYPHRLAEDVEEERRLFHVALTRASRHATVVSSLEPSPFVAELTTEPTQTPTVSLHRPEPAPKAAASKSSPSADLSGDDQGLYDALTNLRNKLKGDKPAYLVFNNKTAAAIAEQRPTTEQQLLAIPGIGPGKFAKYGADIIEVVKGNS